MTKRRKSVAAKIIADREPLPAWYSVTIPKPTSTNRLYASGFNPKTGKHKRFKSRPARSWIAHATPIILISKPPKIAGKYEIRIEVGRRKGSDLFNREKILSDLLKTLGVIAEDSLCEQGVMVWNDDLRSGETVFHIRAWNPRAKITLEAQNGPAR